MLTFVHNPIDHPLFQPTLAVIAVLLGVSLLLILSRTRFRPAGLGGNVLFQRWRVWAVIAPLYALAVLGGALPFLVLITAIVVQGLREYARLVALPASYGRILIAVGVLAAPAALISMDVFHLLAPLLLILATLQLVLLPRQPDRVRHLAFAALGWGYIPWFLAHLMLLDRYVNGGAGVLLVIGLATAMSDVGAFVVGKRFGRHKMAPTISPNKTWEGGAGTLLGAYAGTGLMAFALPPGLGGAALAVLPLVIALGAVWGDLVESAIKREVGVKDAGTWLSGFGGLLDRVDSLIIVAPLVFYFMHLIA
ncbi:MAG: phosphatidate cytidylyltransferase [Chloroflexota bacterium]